MKKCVKCGKEATHRMTVDIDVNGIPCCEKHSDDVRYALVLMTIDKMGAKHFTKDWKQPL